MRVKNPVLQIAIMVIAASAVAVIANGFAANTRRLVLPGFWPNALKVPPRAAETPVAPVAVATTSTVATATIEPVPPATTTITATTASPSPGLRPPSPQDVGRGAGGEGPSTTAAQSPLGTTSLSPNLLAPFQPHPDKAYVEISGEDVALLHSKGVLFLDARRTSVFEEGHIAGARSFSVWEADIDDKVNALFNERSDPREQNLPIVIYCSGGACEDSHMLAQKLWGIQFNNVYVYKDGYPDWLKRGGATRTGGNP